MGIKPRKKKEFALNKYMATEEEQGELIFGQILQRNCQNFLG